MRCHVLIKVRQCRGGWDAQALLDGEVVAFSHGAYTREDAIRRVAEKFRYGRFRRESFRRRGPRKDVRRLRQAAYVMRREGFLEVASQLDLMATQLAAKC